MTPATVRGSFYLLLPRDAKVSDRMDYLNLPIGDKAPDVVTTVVEIPLDGVNKYEYGKTLHLFRLDRNLYSPVHYPGDYGFIQQTIAEVLEHKRTQVLGWKDREMAREVILSSHQRYTNNKASEIV